MIVVVLAATAVPVERRVRVHASLSYGVTLSDVFANVAAYVPVGIVLGEYGALRAIVTASMLAIFAESSQLLMMHRDPSLVDVASNVTGAMFGVLIGVGWRIHPPTIAIDKWSAMVAAALAAAVALGVWETFGDPLNIRGATVPGTLEAHWRFDETVDRVAQDASGHGRPDRFVGEPLRVAGVLGEAIKLDGVRDYVDFLQSTAFRLVGSMTLSAWVKASSNPADDAVIVSNIRRNSEGYDSASSWTPTVDRGPRTIGFKLADACGRLVARYGATPLL